MELVRRKLADVLCSTFYHIQMFLEEALSADGYRRESSVLLYGLLLKSALMVLSIKQTFY